MPSGTVALREVVPVLAIPNVLFKLTSFSPTYLSIIASYL